MRIIFIGPVCVILCVTQNKSNYWRFVHITFIIPPSRLGQCVPPWAPHCVLHINAQWKAGHGDAIVVRNWPLNNLTSWFPWSSSCDRSCSAKWSFKSVNIPCLTVVKTSVWICLIKFDEVFIGFIEISYTSILVNGNSLFNP